MEKITSKDIQQILNENSNLISVILKYQNEGRIMDALLYQTRLQLNLVHLASIADNLPHPSYGIQELTNISPDVHHNVETKVKLAKFISVVKKCGLKDLKKVAVAASITTEEAKDLSTRYIAFLRRQNRNEDADELEKEMSSDPNC